MLKLALRIKISILNVRTFNVNIIKIKPTRIDVFKIENNVNIMITPFIP